MKYFLTLFVLISLGCNKEEAPSPCSNEIELGVLDSRELIPYDSFEVLNFEDQNGQEKTASVNHHTQFNIWFMNKVEIEEESACGIDNSLKKYSWIVDKRNAIITLGFNGHAEELFVSERAFVVDLTDEGPALEDVVIGRHKRAEYYVSFNEPYTPEPFMKLSDNDIMSEEKSEIGFKYYEHYENSGLEFEEVFMNTNKMALTVNYILYNRHSGLVGFIDKDENVWKLKE